MTRASLLCVGTWLCRLGAVFVALMLLSAGSLANERVRLRFVVWDGDEAMVAIRRAVRQFEERYPHISVKLETVTANYQEKLLAQVAANVAPDVAMMDPANFQKFAKRGAFLPLNQFFDDIPGFDINAYYPEIVKPHSYRGTLYVLPRDIAPIAVIYYNKDHFREAGIPFPTNTVKPDGTWDPKSNWTWDFQIRPELREKDFLWVARQLTKIDPQTGRNIRWGYMPAWQGILAVMFGGALGARFLDDYEEPSRVTIDDPRWVKAFRWASELSLKERIMPTSTELSSVLQTNARQLFTQGRVSMFQSGIWEVPGLRRDLWDARQGKMSFDWDIAMAPAYKDGTLIFPTGGSGYAILSQTKHPKEAWLLTAWMAGEPGMIAMAEEGLAQPAIRDLALREPWIPGPNTQGLLQFPQNRIITHYAVPFVLFDPTSMYWGDVSGVMWQNHGRIWDGTGTVERELAISQRNAQQRLETLIREEKLPKFNWWIGAVVGLGLIGTLAAWIYWPERGRKRTLKERRENRVAYLFAMPWILGLLLFTAGPMVLSLLMSFTDWDIIRSAQFRGFGNYVEAFTVEQRFWPSVVVTTIYTVVSVPLGLVVALSLALLLNVKVKGIAFYRTIFYLPSLASAVAAAIIWRAVFRAEGGLLNGILYSPVGHALGIPKLLEPVATANGMVNWLGSEQTALASLIIMSLWGAGGGMVILLASLQSVPQFYYEAATVDGAGAWKRFRAITVPLISPAIFFSLLTGFIGSFQAFSSAFLVTQGGPNNATMFYILNLYNQAFLNLRMGYGSALAWILFVVILFVTLIQLKASKWVYYEGAK